MNKKYTGGFTLIELLVVISIIGILSSVILASLNSAREKARDTAILSDVKQMQLALELYNDKYQEYPPHTPLNACCGYLPGYYTNIEGSNTDNVFKNALNEFLQTLPTPGTFSNANKLSIYTRRIMYRRLTNNTVSGCTSVANNCYAILIYTEKTTNVSTANQATFFLSNGEIRQGFNSTLY